MRKRKHEIGRGRKSRTELTLLARNLRFDPERNLQHDF